MTEVETARSLLVQLATLALMAGGFALMLTAFAPGLRRWVGRMLLLGLLLAVAAGLVTPEWLP